MHPSPFYHATIRRIVTIFGAMFNDLHVQRFNKDGTVKETIRVPLAYGPAERYLRKYDRDIEDDANPRNQILLPRMSYEFNSVVYDSSRKGSALNKFCAPNSEGEETTTTFAKAPYNLEFQLYVMTKYIEDGNQIIEQILPFFQPSYTVTIKDSKEFDATSDVIFTLDSAVPEDNYETDFQDLRSIVWTLNFTARGYLYGPTVSESNLGLIKRAEVVFSNDMDMTQDVSNIVAEVVPSTANQDDPHEIVCTITVNGEEEISSP